MRCAADFGTGRIEVLRLMAETRAAKTSVVSASLLMIPSTVLLVVVFILNNAELLNRNYSQSSSELADLECCWR